MRRSEVHQSASKRGDPRTAFAGKKQATVLLVCVALLRGSLLLKRKLLHRKQVLLLDRGSLEARSERFDAWVEFIGKTRMLLWIPVNEILGREWMFEIAARMSVPWNTAFLSTTTTAAASSNGEKTAENATATAAAVHRVGDSTDDTCAASGVSLCVADAGRPSAVDMPSNPLELSLSVADLDQAAAADSWFRDDETEKIAGSFGGMLTCMIQGIRMYVPAAFQTQVLEETLDQLLDCGVPVDKRKIHSLLATPVLPCGVGAVKLSSGSSCETDNVRWPQRVCAQDSSGGIANKPRRLRCVAVDDKSGDIREVSVDAPRSVAECYKSTDPIKKTTGRTPVVSCPHAAASGRQSSVPQKDSTAANGRQHAAPEPGEETTVRHRWFLAVPRRRRRHGLQRLLVDRSDLRLVKLAARLCRSRHHLTTIWMGNQTSPKTKFVSIRSVLSTKGGGVVPTCAIHLVFVLPHPVSLTCA